MNEKKNIDRLFQEKFKDFEAAPPEFVWDNIQEALQKDKKKRRVIPIWFRLSGAAAVLIIGLTLLAPYFDGTGTQDTPVVIDNREATPADALNADPAIAPIRNGRNTDAAPEGNSQTGTTQTAVATTEEAPAAPATTPAGTGNNNGRKFVDGRKSSVPSHNTFADGQEAIAHGGRTGTAGPATGKRGRQDKATRVEEAVAYTPGTAQTDASRNRASGTNTDDSRNNPAGANIIERSGNPVPYTDSGIAAANEEEKERAGGTPGNEMPQSGNIPAPKEGAVTERATAATEGIAQAETAPAGESPAPENELEKLLREKLKNEKEKEKELAENDDNNKWNIRPQVAPLFYNSLSQGSPINADFTSNSKSYDNDLSYGLGIDYALTDRLSIRSGINTVNLSYATNDITFHASINQETTNIESARSANIVVMNADAGTEDPVSFVIDQKPTQTFNGSMVQRTGYVEVPLELSYALVDKKFGIDLIGGMSTLFLNENNVSVVSSQGYSADVGKAQNLNDVHFSTNIGVGFKYRFWDVFQVNFEPMFKYQVNAYSRDAGNFKPYFIGLYSGITIGF